MKYTSLKRQEIINVIEGKGAAGRIPQLINLWVHPENFGDHQPQIDQLLEEYPCDVQRIRIKVPDVYEAPVDDNSFRWYNKDNPNTGSVRALDNTVVIEDWSELDAVLADFPSPDYSGLFPENPKTDGRYRLAQWFYCLFERHWSLRGMTNALMDFYTDPESVHKLYGALTDYYIAVIRRARKELKIDGIFTSDDLGMQTGPFFSNEIFETFFYPYYKKITDACHEAGIHFWLHTCGNVYNFLPLYAKIGIDVLHPIQKYTMEEKQVAKEFGDKFCFLAGFDVQQIIPWGTPEEVREEVRFMIDTYGREDGRLMITAGNGINEDCTVASLEALLDETAIYY
ncbi:MAG: hypothetical protein OCD02_06555 [Spirochaetaceae bacterium]